MTKKRFSLPILWLTSTGSGQTWRRSGGNRGNRETFEQPLAERRRIHNLEISFRKKKNRNTAEKEKDDGDDKNNRRKLPITSKNLNAEFPLRKFVCITGVSGSGKSTLLHDVLYKNLNRIKSRININGRWKTPAKFWAPSI